MLDDHMGGLRSAVARFRASFLMRQAAVNVGTNIVVLAVSLGTGTVLARSLGTVGRGQLAAALVAPALIAVLVEMGCSQAITYEHARDPSAHRWLIATWLLMLLPLVVVGIVSGELLLLATLRNQGAYIQGLAAWYMTIVFFIVLWDVGVAVLLGDHHFRYVNIQRIAQPMATLIGYLVLALTGHLTVATALLMTYTTVGLISLTCIGASLRMYGLGKPDWVRGRRSLWYGFKAHGTNVSLMVNGRLDQLILPAFVGATTLGLYAVAVSVATIVFSVAAPLAILVLPAAARRTRDQPEIVRRATQASFLIALVVGAGLSLVAEFAVVHVYGRNFAGSVSAVWLLIPGYAVYVAGYTIWQGLYAAGRPFLAFLSQIGGLAVTTGGLLWLLPRGGGIIAAAAVSSISYGVVTLTSLALYSRVSRVPARRFLSWRSYRAEPAPKDSEVDPLETVVPIPPESTL
jgi:O-antigen/teichoic acid export membrane protein